MERESSDEGDSMIRPTKKARTREVEGDPDVVMEFPSIARTIRLWRDCLVHLGLRAEERPKVTRDFNGEGDLDLLEADINSEDFEKVLCEGLWIVYDQYLTVQPWTVDFNTTQAYLSMVMVWIQLPGLPGHLYKRKVLWEIGVDRESCQIGLQHKKLGLGDGLREWRYM
ncbi:hypothetical protein PVK06_020257 [Gossypium arboreum]|uniref:DUF4283 domain-containing protein n=1 Tax=Gossypium arboreum TaxID=29729 RepID=A0ABR0PM21_GOSAR|nr:hypothetical protein PVK06_020257 [Gossypium arboreum]